MAIQINAAQRLLAKRLKLTSKAYQTKVLAFLSEYTGVSAAGLKTALADGKSFKVDTSKRPDLMVFQMTKPVFAALKKACSADQGGRTRDGAWHSGFTVEPKSDAGFPVQITAWPQADSTFKVYIALGHGLSL